MRRFLQEPVTLSTIKRILETATYAPSAHNRQPWRFILLSDQGKRQDLATRLSECYRRDLITDGCPKEEVEARVYKSKQRILEAPVVILICLDVSSGDRYADNLRQQAENLMGVQGVAMAGMTLLLAAHAEGLGGVWMCAPLFARIAVKEVLQLPLSWEPQGMILLGYPKYSPPTRPRRALDELLLII